MYCEVEAGFLNYNMFRNVKMIKVYKLEVECMHHKDNYMIPLFLRHRLRCFLLVFGFDKEEEYTDRNTEV